MTYLVMARKWRPNTFEEMVGQDHIAATIRNAIEGDRIAHAYLFTGTRGVGKTTSARILAKCLNCETGPTPTPCGTCKSCLAITQGNSMDVLEVDGASNNSVDNIRDLREQVKYAPMHGKYKVYIIDEVHMLTKQAFNALLKTLEEPPPHVVFIFATTEIGKVPHTIVSRVQRFDFKRISEAQIEGRLHFICGEEGINAEKSALEILSRKADGSMRDALSLFDQVYAYCGKTIGMADVERILGIPPESLFLEMLEAVKARDVSACLAALSKAYDQGIEFSELLLGFGEYLRDLFFARQPGMTPSGLGTSEKRLAALASAAGDLKDGDILRYAKVISDLLHSLKSSPHPRLAVEMGMARMANLDRVVSLSQILQGSESETAKKKSRPEPLTPELDAPEEPGSDEMPSEPPHFEPEYLEPYSLTSGPQRKTAPEVPLASAGGPARFPETEANHTAIAVLPERDTEEPEPADFPTEEAEPEPFTAREPEMETRTVQDCVKQWPLLVAEFMSMHPLVGAHLQWTTARLEEGEKPELVIAFSQSAAHMLAGEDAEFKKSLHRFLQSKVGASTGFSLAFTLELPEPGAASAPTPAPSASKQLSWEELAQKEPIARLIHELFDGRIVHEHH